MIDILTEFKKTNMLFDKTTQSLTALPYNLEDLKLRLNDYATDKNFNDTIKKLHYNFLYIYRSCNIGNFEVFDSYYYSLSTTQEYPYFRKVENDYEFYTTNNDLVSATNSCVILPFNWNEQSSYVFFADKEYITCIRTGPDVEEYIFKTNNIDPLSGDIKFKNISDLKSDYYDNLYIVDRTYNIIYQYNINSFVSNENIYREKLFLKNLVGGIGTVLDNNKFNGIKNIAVGNNLIVAQDVNNKCFKVFDKNLNWLNTTIFNKLFESLEFFDCLMLDENNNLYAGKNKKIYRFNFLADTFIFEYLDEIDISNYFSENEYIINLLNIPSEKNIFYVQTNLSIKKIWYTSLNYVIGEFNYNKNPNRNIKWMSVAPYTDTKDILILYSLKDGLQNLSLNLDSTYYETLLNMEDILIYELNELLVQKDEYIQSWVILNKLSKLYYNCFALLQNIKYRFSEIDGIDYPVVEKKIYNRGFLGYLNSLDYEKNFEIGINEIFQSSVINRAVKELFDFQYIILLYIINNSNNKVYLSPQPEINNPIVKRYIYYVDESLIVIPNPVSLNIFQELSPGAGILTSLGGAPISSDDSILINEGISI